MMVTKLVQPYVATVPTSVHYLPDCVPATRNSVKSYVHYVLKFVKPVLKSAANTPTATQAAKHVPKPVKNVLKLALLVAKM